MSLRFDLDVDTTRTLRDPLGLESLWVNRNLEKNGGFEALWVILPGANGWWRVAAAEIPEAPC